MPFLGKVSNRFPENLLREIYGWVFFPFTPMTKRELRSAIILCKINRKKGFRIFGHIRTWDISKITDIYSYNCIDDRFRHTSFCLGLRITKTPTLLVALTDLSELQELTDATFWLALNDINIIAHTVWKLSNGKWLVNLLAKSFYLTGSRYSWLVDVCNAGKEGINIESDGRLFNFKVCSDSEELLSLWRPFSSV